MQLHEVQSGRLSLRSFSHNYLGLTQTNPDTLSLSTHYIRVFSWRVRHIKCHPESVTLEGETLPQRVCTDEDLLTSCNSSHFSFLIFITHMATQILFILGFITAHAHVPVVLQMFPCGCDWYNWDTTEITSLDGYQNTSRPPDQRILNLNVVFVLYVDQCFVRCVRVTAC